MPFSCHLGLPMGSAVGFYRSAKGLYATHSNIELLVAFEGGGGFFSFLFAGRSDGDEMLPPLEGVRTYST